VESVQQQLSGLGLLTAQERQTFRQQMNQAGSAEDRAQVRAEHQALILQRTRDFGVGGAFGPDGDSQQARTRYMLMQLTTEQDRLAFHQRMRDAATEQERDRIREEFHEQLRDRAREMGVDFDG
jgi:hypothetical protein